MKITDVRSHVLQYPLDEKLGYSQMYFPRRTAHIVEVITDEGIHGFDEAFGGGQVAPALAHAYFIPVVNHVWGSAVAVVTNLHLLAAMPNLPGSIEPVQPMLEYDTTPNRFREELLVTPLSIPDQVKRNGGGVSLPPGPGLGVEMDLEFMKKFEV